METSATYDVTISFRASISYKSGTKTNDVEYNAIESGLRAELGLPEDAQIDLDFVERTESEPDYDL